MLSIMRYIFLFLPLLFMGCKKSEFNLEFTLSSDVTDNYNVNYYATDTKGGITIQAVASVRNGKCSLKGVTKLPTVVYITSRTSLNPLILIAQSGEKIEISGEDKDPLAWQVEGSEINADLSKWRIENLETLQKNNADSVNLAVKTYVEENPRNPVSTILMLGYFHRHDDEREYADLMGSLSGEAKASQWLEMMGRTDQLDHRYFYPARLQSLIMKASEKGVDTLMVNGRDPLMLLFWQTGYSDRKNIIDSIKALEKEVKDTCLLLADVCLDVDSSAWRGAIRRDSLGENVKRFWTPAGVADPKMQKFKIDALPYFIVFDKEGNQNYRGADLASAMNEYRNLVEASDTTKKKDKKDAH